jgi:hypothetical protein
MVWERGPRGGNSSSPEDGGGRPPESERVSGFRRGPSGPFRATFFGRSGGVRVFGSARAGAAGCLTSGRVTDRTPCLREKPRTGPGGKPQESWRGRETSSTRAFGEALELRAVGLPESGGRKGMREGGGKPSLRRAGKDSGEAGKPMRASAFPGFRPRVGTDRRREQRPGAAGHRDLLVLRAG